MLIQFRTRTFVHSHSSLFRRRPASPTYTLPHPVRHYRQPAASQTRQAETLTQTANCERIHAPTHITSHSIRRRFGGVFATCVCECVVVSARLQYTSFVMELRSKVVAACWHACGASGEREAKLRRALEPARTHCAAACVRALELRNACAA